MCIDFNNTPIDGSREGGKLNTNLSNKQRIVNDPSNLVKVFYLPEAAHGERGLGDPGFDSGAPDLDLQAFTGSGSRCERTWNQLPI
jgi:hypothetical protein